MGLFKGMKGLAEVTKNARQLQDQQQVQGGYKPGMRGMMSQMGDMVGTMNEQIKDIAEQSGDQQRLLSEGMPGQAVIVAMGTPARGALQFNLYLDLEVHVNGLAPYQIRSRTSTSCPHRRRSAQGLSSRSGSTRTTRPRSRSSGPTSPMGQPLARPGRSAAPRLRRALMHRATVSATRSGRSNGSPSCATPALSPRPSSPRRKQRYSVPDRCRTADRGRQATPATTARPTDRRLSTE